MAESTSHLKTSCICTKTKIKSIAEKIYSDCAAVMAPDNSGKYLICLENYKLPKKWLKIKNSLDQKQMSYNAFVFFTGISIIKNDLYSQVNGINIESVMILPVYKNNKIVAILEFIHTKNNKNFTIQDLHYAYKVIN